MSESNVIHLKPADQGLSPEGYLQSVTELPLRDRDEMLLPEGITDTDLAITLAATCLASAKHVKGPKDQRAKWRAVSKACAEALSSD